MILMKPVADRNKLLGLSHSTSASDSSSMHEADAKRCHLQQRNGRKSTESMASSQVDELSKADAKADAKAIPLSSKETFNSEK